MHMPCPGGATKALCKGLSLTKAFLSISPYLQSSLNFVIGDNSTLVYSCKNVRVTNGRQEVVQLILRKHVFNQSTSEAPLASILCSMRALFRGFFMDKLCDALGGNGHSIVLSVNAMELPLPNLSSADFGRGRILHGSVERDASDATEPGLGVGEDDGNALSKTSAGDGIALGNVRQPKQVRFRHIRTHQARIGLDLVRRLHVLVEHSTGHLNEGRVGNPRAIMTGQNLAPLVFLDLSHFRGIGCRIVLDGDRRRHPAHGKSAALVADVDETLHVGLHERSGHGKMAAIGGDLVVVRLELLDVAEEVVPATAVEAKRVVLELIEDLHSRFSEE